MKPENERFTGSIVALVTPMLEDGGLDLESWERMLQWHADAGTDGLVVAGTTGEGACLEEDEFERLLRPASQWNCGPVICGIGSPATAKSLRLLRIAERCGADALLAVTPYYNRPPQEGLSAHFRALAQATALPLILYNVPARTGVDLLPETVAELAAVDNIIGLKEANVSRERLPALLALPDSDFVILSGDDPSCCGSALQGAHGVVSVAANLAPKQFRRMIAAARRGDEATARTIEQDLKPLFATLAAASNPIAIKWALAEAGLINTGIRLPLVWLDRESRDKHRQVVHAALAAEQTGAAIAGA